MAIIRSKDPLYVRWINMNDTNKREFYDAYKDSDIDFIDPSTNNLNELEKQWETYLGMTKPFRRRSDWIMLKYMECTNEDIYNLLKSELIKDAINPTELVTPDDIMSEAAYIPDNEKADYARILAPIVGSPDFEEKVKEAEDWMLDTGFVLIIPLTSDFYGHNMERRTEERWEYYNMLTKKHRRECDWKSLELFGLTVPQVYSYLRSHYNRQDINDIEPSMIPDESPFTYASYMSNYCTNTLMGESAKEIGETLVKLSRPNDNFLESINNTIIADTIDLYDKNSLVNIDIDYTDLPAFSPEEMIDMGIHAHVPEDNFFNVVGDALIPGEELLEWFSLYEAVYNGLPITNRYEELNRKRIQTLESVYAKYSSTNMPDNIKQSVLEMGWNPVMNFSPETRVLVDKNQRKRIKNNFGESRIINLCGFGSIESPNQQIFEDASTGILRPIFICFAEGTNVFSNIIKGFTKGTYSHASISFDPEMNDIYSYGMEETIGQKGFVGGITKESIKNKPPEAHFGVYAVFVDNDIYNRIKSNVEWFINNAKQTAYSYANILAITFRIPMERENKMICSQFVDRMLKLGGIDITKKSSSLVDPNYLRRASKATKNIYKIFEGKVKSFHPKIIRNRVAQLTHKAKAFTGYMSEFYLRENTCFYSSYLEIIDELALDVDPNTTLGKIYEHIYKPCLEAQCIHLADPEALYHESGYDLYDLAKQYVNAYKKNPNSRKTIREEMISLNTAIRKRLGNTLHENLEMKLNKASDVLEKIISLNLD